MNWTKEQREAIEYGGENILLAAAAGSGKTAVLVQRIIELISPLRADGTKNENPADIGELLVLTFTDAAASEMRDKIANAIRSALEQNPEDRHLKKQSIMVNSADISTIHSFCLNVLKSNIHLTELPVDFVPASKEESTMLLSDAIDSVLERYYSRIDRDSSFERLVMGYGGLKNDSDLRSLIISTLKFAKSMPYPAAWLNSAAAMYRHTAKEGSLDRVWQDAAAELLDRYAEELESVYSVICERTESLLGEEHPYYEFFRRESAYVLGIMKGAERTYDGVRRAVYSIAFNKIASTPRKTDAETKSIQKYIQSLRIEAKDAVKELQGVFARGGAAEAARIAECYPILRTLKNIVLTVDRAYKKNKYSKGLVDFNDLEHEALRLLADKDGNPTETALALRDKYREILVDEYQDTNNIQDTIFRAVSRDNTNIFMVGDIKQSIYKFRNAVPALFTEKYAAYGADKGAGHLIRLFKNFRSREGIVNAVNYIFDGIMSRAVGDVSYTDEEYLRFGAEYYPAPENTAALDTELHLICAGGELADGEAVPECLEGKDKTYFEAELCAKRIRDITDGSFTVYDKNTGECRAVEYRDIVILIRSPKNAAPIFEEVLSRYSIPVYTQVGKSYLSSPEVLTVMSVLRAVDNPRCDIPLIAAMRSPIWGFSPDELAEIRCANRKCDFYGAVKESADAGNGKAAGFLADLDELRKMSGFLGVDRLIHEIYYGYGYYAYTGAMEHGEERRANLRLLYERAAEFEHTKLSGLFSFMNYIETVKKSGGDLTPARIFGEGDNVVRIMSDHKSKGLEFPVVILADIRHKFNSDDLKPAVLRHESLGIGMDFVDTKRRVRYPTISRTLVRRRIKSELMSEEMRVLYVALTRAREKLIIISTVDERAKKWRSPLLDGNGRVLESYVRGCENCFEWLTAALFPHRGAENMRDFCGAAAVSIRGGAEFGLKTFVYENAAKIPLAAHHAAAEDAGGTENAAAFCGDKIKEILDYEYPGLAESGIPVKVSVSEAKRMQAEDGEYVPRLEGLEPQTLSEPEEIVGAERGTVVHFVIQYADEKKIRTAEDVRGLLSEMCRGGVITEKQAAAVDAESVCRLFTGELGQRMCAADRVEKEFSFYTTASADELYHNGSSAPVLLQGTIDCFFTEGDRVILLDYKTDKVKDAAAARKRAESYRVQMKYYKKGLSEILGRPVDECYLYFLECDTAVEM